ncbi:Zn(II)2Cys6 transcription factor domain-containing protein [Aspergillus homomorphus CBS 101889]|uniref:Zn(2)-C6 fungal-type domain-containing protein n=1 Tax=Aspergillus homomorphus (strain CBS 101889) TaxID=1450537 RepID=A0A395HX58_ASPHC|nr:hypothetical protein BO97DRAFT_415613 [Aspergillus homomorphus CBS 101889]RAL10824.1 hypothetical protein BO97DRAFT_415613 [Aspergillus homomorphus CBS 101889]
MADSTRTTPKFTRCRTGCLRCRTRRRKCDEGKPRCQNCVDKNFVCSYGMQVTFLSKNTYTVPAKEVRAPRSKRRFQNLRFIEEDPLTLSGTDANVVEGEEDGEAGLKSSSPIIRLVDSAKDRAEDEAGGEDHSVTGGNAGSESAELGDHDGSSHGGPDGSLNGGASLDSHGAFSDRDTSAVQGLLALGSGLITQDLQHALAPDISCLETPSAPIADALPLMMITTAGPADDGRALRRQSKFSGGVVGASPLSTTTSEERTLDLLRHYRYFVAPWMDICDLKHPFGIVATQMATRSEQILSALLTLSEACMIHRDYPQAHAVTLDKALPQRLQLESGLASDFKELTLLSVLERLRFLVSDLSHGWKTLQNYNLGSLEPLIEHALLLDIESSVYWMFLRLDLSVALANDTGLQIPLPSGPVPNLELLSRTHDTHERVSLYARVLLWLCGKALMVCHEQPSPRHFPDCHQLLDSWLQVSDELDRWYKSRPQEFRPLVELEGINDLSNPGSGFPLVVFANGVGAYCNQLYHTAVLLLLQCKPRTALLNSQARFLSPLWHSQRICGIALNNDGRDCWDPCLVASFLVSARTMTHESQQKAILQGFERIHSITGWHIGRYLSHLQQDWAFLDGV